MTVSGLGCVETAADEDLISSIAGIFEFGGHFRFFGLAQTLESWFERHPAQPGFTQRLLYRLVRHPISFGWLVLPWLVPVFTVGQLILGLGFALYILAVTPLEEAELRREIGHDYDAYAKKTPRFFPYLLPRNR